MAWPEWDREHGLAWRARHRCCHNTDHLELHWLVTGETRTRMNECLPRRELMETHVAKTAADAADPDPPGFELVTD